MANKQHSSRIKSYRTDRLSEIPTMASAISKKISLFKEQHRNLVEESQSFFENYKDDRKQLYKLKKRMATYNEHINTIEEYKKKNGKLPKVKGQESTEKFLRTLYNSHDKDKKEYKETMQRLNAERIHRYEGLDHLVDNMLDLLDSNKIFSQFLGTIALSTPLPDEKVRCVRNEKFKPIYIAALTVGLFDQIRCKVDFNVEYLNRHLSEIFNNDTIKLGLHDPAMPAEVKIAYREEILKPLANAALIQHIGSYSPEAEAIFDDDRYRQLTLHEREQLIEVLHAKSMDYMKYAIGIPPKRFDNKDDKQAYMDYESGKMQFTLSILNSLSQQQNELGDVLRIPMVYSSFMVSTKPDFDYEEIYDAYNIIAKGAKQQRYRQDYAELFLNMVGRFPLGSGIFFISQESGVIERGIVSSLYPEDADSAICKQITKNQIQSLSQTEVVVDKKTNIYFKEARNLSEYEPEYFKQRFEDEYTWNANALWEVQVPALTFWKKDGTIKFNSLEEQEES
ncbi:V-type ATP synthase subunit I domain-containing protein [Flocculibacter collagenilyticus]|uniref:hypothetical protein n=1 Tax=Flocculibacter collagenilyticus TaxID=2744479 RepID=UPI0018F5FCE1|nr:hypothetical protein [Flocculibacter collagenilyticus]